MLNRVELIGHLGQDPAVKQTQGGAKIVNFTIATSERWRDRATGEQKERTEWHRVVIFADKLGEIAERYLRKGSRCFLAGKLQTRKWQDPAGNDRYTTEVVLDQFRGQIVLLDRKADEEPASENYGRKETYQPKASGPDTSFADLDDEIPF